MNEIARRMVEEARSFANVPFQHQGRSRDGIDCIGLVLAAMQGAGYEPGQMAQRRDYGRIPSSDTLLQCLETEADCVSGVWLVREWSRIARPADIVLMTYKPETHPRHLALVTDVRPETPQRAGALYIIHTNGEFGCVKEHNMFPTYARCAVGLYRLKNLHV